VDALEIQMPKLRVTVACERYDRVQAIRDGDVQIEGCEVNFLELPPEELFFRAYRHREFDISEISMSSYLLGLSRGDSPYFAIPVFLSRLFRHSAIYIRTDRGIERPEDLRGKKVGVPEYQVTAALWARALLDGEYGVKPADLRWFRGGLHEPGRIEKVSLNLPPEIRISPIDERQTLNQMFAGGELDAMISPRAPRCFLERDPHIRLLFRDYRAAEEAYYARRKIFPIMHVLGIRRDLVDQHPWLANSVYEAFVRAKKRALELLDDVAALKVTLPWLPAYLDETRAIMGDDFWPYGVKENLPTLNAMVEFAYRHGTTSRLLKVEELFVPSTLERYKI
jgi:4,5-dihydroxyphthalate decarboxylase